MMLLAKALREPLVHFLAIGIGVFAFYSLSGPAPEAPDRETIVVSEGRVAQLAEVFQRTWQRPPTAEELQGLVDGFVKEEVYYREALKLGLDHDDTLIRRRLQQKLDFLIEPPAAELQPDDAELESYLEDNRERFRVDPRIAFRQVFVRAGRAGEPALQRASALLDELRRSEAAAEAGDPSLLPAALPLTPLRLIGRTFGESFAAEIAGLPAGSWSGPVTSPYGLHLVWIDARAEGYAPPLAEVRELVLQEWRHEKREAYAEEAYRRMLEDYEIVLPGGAESEPAK